MNLVINGLDAVAAIDGNLELASTSQRAKIEHRVVAVSDRAAGLPPLQAHQI